VVPRRGSLVATGELFEPYRLVDGDGAVVVPVAGFFAELAACGRPATTQRSYGMWISPETVEACTMSPLTLW